MMERLNPYAKDYIPLKYTQTLETTQQNFSNPNQPPQLQMIFISNNPQHNDYHHHHHHHHDVQTPLFSYSHPLIFSDHSTLHHPQLGRNIVDHHHQQQHHGHDHPVVNRIANPSTSSSRVSRQYCNNNNNTNGRGRSYYSKPKSKMMYVRKTDCSTSTSQRPSQLSDSGDNNVTTTIMIRNIPSKYTRGLLMEFIDEFCKLENESNKTTGQIHAFDFLYLPIDFRTKMNKGYGFVNFTTKEAASKFEEKTKDKTWPHFNSNKIRRIAKAKIQGKEGMIKNYEKMRFDCKEGEFLPVLFNPARDGKNQDYVKSQNIGIFIGG